MHSKKKSISFNSFEEHKRLSTSLTGFNKKIAP